jgi:hypothetical protein
VRTALALFTGYLRMVVHVHAAMIPQS